MGIHAYAMGEGRVGLYGGSPNAEAGGTYQHASGFRIKTAVTKQFRKWNGYKFITAICNGHSPTDTSVRSGVQYSSGYVTAVAAGQSQRFYSGVGTFNWYWYYLSSPPQIPRGSRVLLELRWLICLLHRGPEFEICTKNRGSGSGGLNPTAQVWF
jgi:hypothetical protein